MYTYICVHAYVYVNINNFLQNSYLSYPTLLILMALSFDYQLGVLSVKYFLLRYRQQNPNDKER